MLNDLIFENIRNEFKKIYKQLQDDKIASHKPANYLFYHNQQPYEINFIIDLLKSKNVSLTTDNCTKITHTLELLKDIAKDLNENKEQAKIELLEKEEQERINLITQVKERLKENGALFDCQNLQCIYVSFVILTESADFFKFISKNEFIYTVRGAHVKVYKNTTENIKEKISNFLKNDFEDKTVLFDSHLFFKSKLQWEDILNYCEQINRTIFIN